MKKNYTLGIVGVRGYVGKELINLLANHDEIQVAWVSSRQLSGQSVAKLVEADTDFLFTELPAEHYYHQLTVENISAAEVAEKQTDIIVLALPNGLAAPFVDALDRASSTKLIIDLSADYRFSDDWFYSLPELNKSSKKTQQLQSQCLKISNPGCYATAMQLALAPIKNEVGGFAHCFGISGYSGAGTKPSKNNDPANLKNNILAYSLLEHLHEKEVSFQLGTDVFFTPHVAAFFRGISMTVQLELKSSWTETSIIELFSEFYNNDKHVRISQEIPNIGQVVNTKNCIIGGFKLSKNGKRLSFVSCLDNLMKGAASQALQNIEIALQLNQTKS